MAFIIEKTALIDILFKIMAIIITMVIHDQHVHSAYSFDSEQPIEEYLSLAIEAGVSYFVLTDHYDANYLDKGEDLSFDIERQHKELESLQKKYPSIKMLKGIEVGYKPNRIKEILNKIHRYDFDLINLSLHESDGIDYFLVDTFIELGIDTVLNIYFQRILEMVNDFDDFDVLCHLDYGFKTAYRIDPSISISKYEDVISKIMTTLIKKDKTFELNTKVQEYLPLSHTKYILNLYKRLGGTNITLSSDAHKKDRYRSSFDKYLPLIKEAGFDHLVYFVKRKRQKLKI